MATPLNKDSFLKLLPTLGFTKKGDVFSKTIGAATLAVDMTKEELIYPTDQGLKISDRTTCNFSSDENFVVFECVHRLLKKGYKAAHMELEPKWKTGHGASAG